MLTLDNILYNRSHNILSDMLQFLFIKDQLLHNMDKKLIVTRYISERIVEEARLTIAPS